MNLLSSWDRVKEPEAGRNGPGNCFGLASVQPPEGQAELIRVPGRVPLVDSHEPLAHTTAHKKPGTFLKALILHLGSEEHRQLYAKLAKAERDEKCIRRAVFLMVVLFMVGVAGVAYCAILLPEVFRNPNHTLMRSLYGLLLWSLISQLAFLGYLIWHRIEVTRLHRKCQHLILALARSQLEARSAP